MRKEHLLKDDPDRLLDEGEEEFYYTEIEDEGSLTPTSPQQLLIQQTRLASGSHAAAVAAMGLPHQQYIPIRARSYSSSDSSASQLATLSLVDHLDMARPAHEDPGRGAITQRSILVPSSSSSLLAMRPRESAISMPITIAPSAVS